MNFFKKDAMLQSPNQYIMVYIFLVWILKYYLDIKYVTTNFESNLWRLLSEKFMYNFSHLSYP